jgi:hypothetical protein
MLSRLLIGLVIVAIIAVSSAALPRFYIALRYNIKFQFKLRYVFFRRFDVSRYPRSDRIIVVLLSFLPLATVVVAEVLLSSHTGY